MSVAQVAANAAAVRNLAARLERNGYVGDAHTDEKMEARLAKRISVDSGTGCWLWTGIIHRTGYGRITNPDHRHRSLSAHRVVFEQLVGPIPEGLDLDHLCRVRHCVNPAHLEPVTRQVNILRGATVPAANAKKTHCFRDHPLCGDNLHITPNGHRQCRACRRLTIKRRKERIGIEEFRRIDRERAAIYSARKRSAS